MVVLAWDLAPHVKEDVEMYRVKWYESKFPDQMAHNDTSFQNYTFHALDMSKIYNVQVSMCCVSDIKINRDLVDKDH
jgi:hypothetical protein